MSEIAPVVSEVTVRATPERAFTMFTANIGDWWPTEQNSVYKGTVAFEGAELVERSGDKTATWGEVTRWDPPTALGFTWHPGHDATRTTDVLVTFTQSGDNTLVRLTHSAWERLGGDIRELRDEYEKGWPPVLGDFARMFD